MEKGNKDVIFMSGIGVLILGIMMILLWWPDVTSLFRGVLGVATAVAGLLMMYSKKV